MIEDIIQADEEILDLIVENTMENIKDFPVERKTETNKNNEKNYLDNLLSKYSRNK